MASARTGGAELEQDAGSAAVGQTNSGRRRKKPNRRLSSEIWIRMRISCELGADPPEISVTPAAKERACGVTYWAACSVRIIS